jgi:gamma-glutamylputrescine oxidase
LIAQAIHGDSTGFDAMASVPSQRFPGGTLLRSPLLVLAMTWYGLRDRFGV